MVNIINIIVLLRGFSSDAKCAIGLLIGLCIAFQLFFDLLSNCSDSTGFYGHVFSGTYELKNDLGSGSGKSSEDISVIPELESSWIISQQTFRSLAEPQNPIEPDIYRAPYG
jgi:hypothetical protein